jgi:tryptophan synthase beta subunit
MKRAKDWTRKDLLIINISGRGDKDVQQMEQWDAEHRPRRETDQS